MKKLLLLALFISTPSFAFDPSQLDFCAGYAINYALLVTSAHDAKDRAAFDKVVERQIANQPPGTSDQAKASIHKFAEEAWRERNVPPTMAGVDWFHQCTQAIIRSAMKQQR